MVLSAGGACLRVILFLNIISLFLGLSLGPICVRLNYRKTSSETKAQLKHLSFGIKMMKNIACKASLYIFTYENKKLVWENTNTSYNLLYCYNGCKNSAAEE